MQSETFQAHICYNFDDYVLQLMKSLSFTCMSKFICSLLRSQYLKPFMENDFPQTNPPAWVFLQEGSNQVAAFCEERWKRVWLLPWTLHCLSIKLCYIKQSFVVFMLLLLLCFICSILIWFRITIDHLILPFDKPGSDQMSSSIFSRSSDSGTRPHTSSNKSTPRDHTVAGLAWYVPSVKNSGGQ